MEDHVTKMNMFSSDNSSDFTDGTQSGLLLNIIKEVNYAHTAHCRFNLCKDVEYILYICSQQKEVQPQVTHLAKACYAKFALIQAVANTMGFMPVMAAVVFLSAAWGEDSSTGKQDADWTS